MKMLCKKGYKIRRNNKVGWYCNFVVGEWYDFQSIRNNEFYSDAFEFHIIFVSYIHAIFPHLYKYFYTNSEVRKMKLERLAES